MATVRISQLTAITAPTDDDVFIINDADTNTRKITFANLTQSLLNTSATSQVKAGGLTVSGPLTASNNFTVDTNTFFVDSVSNRVGIRNTAPATELDIDGSLHLRNGGEVQFGDANDSNYISVKAPGVVTSNFSMTLPTALPSSTAFLTSTSTGEIGYSTGISISSGTLGVSQIDLNDRGTVRFYEQAANGSEYVELKAPTALSFTTSYQLPSTFPTATGEVLSCSTTGVLSWVSNAAGASGADGQIQYAQSGVLSSSTGLVFQPSTNLLTAANITVSGTFTAEGAVTLGNETTDSITFGGRLASNLIPSADLTYDLGGPALRFETAYLDNLEADGNVSIGTVVSDLVPTAASYDLGAPAARWQNTYSDTFHTGTHSVQTASALANVGSAGQFNVTLGAQADYTSFKVLIQATDDITGDVEFYEYFIVQDGAGGISEATGSNVQAPTPGLFLTTPAVSIAGGDVILAITNSAASGNTVSIRVQSTALAA